MKHYKLIVALLALVLLSMLTMAAVTLVNGPVAASRIDTHSQPINLGGAGPAAPLPNVTPTATPSAGAWL